MGQHDSAKHKGIVEYYLERDPQGPIQVAIAPFAALYRLDRRAKDFTAWFALVKRSKAEKKAIVFTYDVRDLTFTSIDLAP